MNIIPTMHYTHVHEHEHTINKSCNLLEVLVRSKSAIYPFNHVCSCRLSILWKTRCYFTHTGIFKSYVPVSFVSSIMLPHSHIVGLNILCCIQMIKVNKKGLAVIGTFIATNPEPFILGWSSSLTTSSTEYSLFLSLGSFSSMGMALSLL